MGLQLVLVEAGVEAGVGAGEPWCSSADKESMVQEQYMQ